MIQTTFSYEYDPDYQNEEINMVVILQLHEGQEVWVTPYGIMSIDGAFIGFGMSSWFSGHLVYAL